MAEINDGETRRGDRLNALRQHLTAVGARLWRAGHTREDDQPAPAVEQSTSPERRRVPAIVLTCDRYHPFAAHMIMRYDAVWPSHPFAFHVPFQQRPLPGVRIAARQTPEAIRGTVLGLLQEFDDETWIYWCIDDKYPIQLVQPTVARLAEAVVSDRLPGVDGVIFCRWRKLLRPEHLLEERRDAPGGVVLRRRINYAHIMDPPVPAGQSAAPALPPVPGVSSSPGCLRPDEPALAGRSPALRGGDEPSGVRGKHHPWSCHTQLRR